MKRDLEFYLNNMTNNIIFVSQLGSTGKDMFVSDGIKTLLGWPKEKSLSDYGFYKSIIHPDDLKKFQEALRHNNYNITFTYRVKKASGEYIKAVTNNYCVETDGVYEAFGVISLIEN